MICLELFSFDFSKFLSEEFIKEYWLECIIIFILGIVIGVTIMRLINNQQIKNNKSEKKRLSNWESDLKKLEEKLAMKEDQLEDAKFLSQHNLSNKKFIKK